MRTFFEQGGTVINSSPMYGTSEAVIGDCLARIGHEGPLFSATKVWTPLKWFGPGQMEESRELWGVARFDLMQIHNLLSWEGHLETLLEDKDAGRIRYIGITTSHGRRHDEFEQIMADAAARLRAVHLQRPGPRGRDGACCRSPPSAGSRS